jgi:hypothetical protein
VRFVDQERSIRQGRAAGSRWLDHPEGAFAQAMLSSSRDARRIAEERLMSNSEHVELTTSAETTPPSRRLSRRALMKAAAIAPVVAAGRQAWANPSAVNLSALAMVAPFPPAGLEYVRTKSVADVPGVDADRVELVWRVLWSHFVWGLGKATRQDDVALVKAAYDEPVKLGALKTTGTLIAENVQQDKFDPIGNDYQTNVCAYICGHKAALAALADPNAPKPIDPAIYKVARADTQKEMSAKLVVARGPGGGQPATPGSASLGFAC